MDSGRLGSEVEQLVTILYTVRTEYEAMESVSMRFDAGKTGRSGSFDYLDHAFQVHSPVVVHSHTEKYKLRMKINRVLGDSVISSIDKMVVNGTVSSDPHSSAVRVL